MIGKQDIKFSVVRYGNVMGSRGSVVPSFLNQSKSGKFYVTHKDMTRFNITLSQSVKMVEYVINQSIGGEIYIPKIPSFKITDLAKAINPKAKIVFSGIREGEKLHEDLISINDAPHTIDIGNYYIICPFNNKLTRNIIKKFKGKKVKKSFFYNSGTNKNFLSITAIKNLVKQLDKI